MLDEADYKRSRHRFPGAAQATASCNGSMVCRAGPAPARRWKNPTLPHTPPKIAAKAAPTTQQGLFVEAASAASARSSPPAGCCDSRSSPPGGCRDSRSSPSAGCHDNPIIPSLRVPRQQTHPLPPGGDRGEGFSTAAPARRSGSGIAAFQPSCGKTDAAGQIQFPFRCAELLCFNSPAD